MLFVVLFFSSTFHGYEQLALLFDFPQFEKASNPKPTGVAEKGTQRWQGSQDPMGPLNSQTAGLLSDFPLKVNNF